MKKIYFLSLALFAVVTMQAQDWAPESTEWWYPEPAIVKPGKTPGQPPSDAIILFDGSDLSKWTSDQGGEPGWKIANGVATIDPGKGGIRTKEYFGDCQLHLEFKLPPPVKADAENPHGQSQGNSGVLLQGRYEVQILDPENNKTYVNGMLGSIYKQTAPLVNPYTTNGEWQVYDIYWKAPKFGTGDRLESPAIITVVLNGVLIQNNYILQGHTPYRGLPAYSAHGRLPLGLQDHGRAISFRNIWIRNL
ncbi:MAG: DUF1080 domain-containing protein [Tannerella sp.]|nr:DUF1080 domain-containing protein [Tannerella sp.]